MLQNNLSVSNFGEASIYPSKQEESIIMDGLKLCKVASRMRHTFTDHPVYQDPEKGQSYRVAARWLLANEVLEYDLLLRLQVLEGAVGIHVGLWFGRGGRQGLRLARQYFVENPQPLMDPLWLSPQYSKMYGVVEAKLDNVIRSFLGSKIEPRDIINQALMGMAINPNDPQTTLRAAYRAGKYLAEGIFSGKETPIKVGAGLLSEFLKRKVMNEKKQTRLQRQLPVSEEGEVLDIADTSHTDAWKALGTLAFRNLADPVGKKLRGLMRSTWEGIPSIGKGPMLAWLDAVERGEENISKKELSERFGISPQNFSAKFWSKFWLEFYKALWSNRPMIKLIQNYLRAQGLEWEPVQPSIADAPKEDSLSHLKRYLKTTPSDKMAVSLLHRWETR